MQPMKDHKWWGAAACGWLVWPEFNTACALELSKPDLLGAGKGESNDKDE